MKVIVLSKPLYVHVDSKKVIVELEHTLDVYDKDIENWKKGIRIIGKSNDIQSHKK